jgi:hypothetical protein
LIIATAASAYYISGQWAAMRDTLDATNKLVEKAQEQVAATNRQAEAAATANELAQHALEVSRRPVIALNWIFVMSELKAGQRIAFEVHLMNNGGVAQHVPVDVCASP